MAAWRHWRLIARSRMTGRAWGVFGRHHTPRPRPLDSGGTQQTSAANGGKILCSDGLGWSLQPKTPESNSNRKALTPPTQNR